MFENNEFFIKQKKNRDESEIELNITNGNSGIIFGIISLISSVISFTIMFGSYSILNIYREITNRPLEHIKLMIFVAIIMFALAAIVFGIIGILNYFKKEKNSTANTIGVVISAFAIILGIATIVLNFMFF